MINNERYPKDFQEFLAQFKNEDDCWDYIYDLRWPNGFVCPKCKSSDNYWKTEQKLIHCSVCGHQASITGGYNFSWHEKTFTALVSHYVVGSSSENWSKCI